MPYTYTSVQPKVQLYTIIRGEEFFNGSRYDAGSTQHPLQVSLLNLPTGHAIKPHKHILQYRETYQTVEAWVVVKGEILATFYDLSNIQIESITLRAGDCAILYSGGHRFKAIGDSLIYEIKNGPYNGADKDRQYI